MVEVEMIDHFGRPGASGGHVTLACAVPSLIEALQQTTVLRRMVRFLQHVIPHQRVRVKVKALEHS